MSTDNIIEFNGKQINCERLTDDSLIKLYKNMRDKQVSLYEQLLRYREVLGIEDEELENLLSEFENSVFKYLVMLKNNMSKIIYIYSIIYYYVLLYFRYCILFLI